MQYLILTLIKFNSDSSFSKIAKELLN